MEYVFGLDRIPENKLSLIGGKAKALSKMLKYLKVNVPYGYVLTMDAIEGGKLKDKANVEVDKLIKMLDDNETYAVRSSALNEDGEKSSFAGQYETVTNVSTSKIKEAIQQVLDSANNSRVKEYTDAFEEENKGIAVVIQLFVKPTFAGVLFTSNIITGSDAYMTGNYVHGEGEKLVSGAMNAKCFRINSIKYEFEGNKEIEPYGKRMYQFCNAIRRYYEIPMDVEWAISGKKLYILQARPITTLCRLKSENYMINGSLSGNKLLTRTNVGEIFMKPVSPMTFSVLEKINKYLGLSDWLDNIYGQPYMNISIMCSFLVSFGMSKEKAFEKIKDLAGTIPEGIDIPISPFDKKAFIKNLQKILLPKNKCKLSKSEKHKLINDVPQICETLIHEIKVLESNEELNRYWNDRLIPLLQDGLSAVISVSGKQMLPLFLTRGTIAKVAGDDIANRLCTGCVGVVDCMKPLLFMEDVISGKITKEEYVKICGHRCVNEMELMEPRPYENSEYFDIFLEDYTQQEISLRSMQQAQEKEFEVALKDFKDKYPHKSKWIERKIYKYKVANQLREDIRSKGVWMFCVFREYLLQVGKVNALGNDIFMLMFDEIFMLLDHKIEAINLITGRKESYIKYTQYPTFPSLILGRFLPDKWVELPNRRNDFYCENIMNDTNNTNNGDGLSESVKGFPGASGVVEGVVRVITDSKDMGQIEKGDILVTTATNIGWTLVFPKVSAIVTDIGAPLSHAAIVAREFGIPAVVGCGNATTLLKTGDKVLVDGAKGSVVKINNNMDGKYSFMSGVYAKLG